jgi:hypothetical protein
VHGIQLTRNALKDDNKKMRGRKAEAEKQRQKSRGRKAEAEKQRQKSRIRKAEVENYVCCKDK